MLTFSDTVAYVGSTKYVKDVPESKRAVKSTSTKVVPTRI